MIQRTQQNNEEHVTPLVNNLPHQIPIDSPCASLLSICTKEEKRPQHERKQKQSEMDLVAPLGFH